MIEFYHLGHGGRYTQYLNDTVRKISRRRPALIGAKRQGTRSHTVVITQGAPPLTEGRLRTILAGREVTFILGDSRGVPSALVSEADEAVSLSQLCLPHHLEAAVLVEQVERIVSEEPDYA